MEEGQKFLMTECCGGRERFVDSDCGNTEDGYSDGGGEGYKEGEMQESGGIQEDYVGESREDDGTMCALNVTRRVYVEGGSQKCLCGGSSAGGRGEIEQQIYHDNHLPAEAPVLHLKQSTCQQQWGHTTHSQWHL